MGCLLWILGGRKWTFCDGTLSYHYPPHVFLSHKEPLLLEYDNVNWGGIGQHGFISAIMSTVICSGSIFPEIAQLLSGTSSCVGIVGNHLIFMSVVFIDIIIFLFMLFYMKYKNTNINNNTPKHFLDRLHSSVLLAIYVINFTNLLFRFYENSTKSGVFKNVSWWIYMWLAVGLELQFCSMSGWRIQIFANC